MGLGKFKPLKAFAGPMLGQYKGVKTAVGSKGSLGDRSKSGLSAQYNETTSGSSLLQESNPIDKAKFGGDKVIGPDAEAAELRRIKMKAALGEEQAFDMFRKRLDENTDNIFQQRINLENEGRRAAAADESRSVQENITQRGLGRSSIGLTAMRNIEQEASKDIARNTASFQERSDAEKLKRLSEFRDVAAGTLSGTPVPVRFYPTKEEGFLKTLAKGVIPAVAGGLAGGFGGGVGAAAGSSLFSRKAKSQSAIYGQSDI